MKIGIGFDIHKLVPDRELVLGGLKIPCQKGLMGHSDGDVILHAICDAILGALGKPDIGCYFPDTDESIKGIESTEILKKVAEIMKSEKFKINNVDIVIVAEQPKLSPYYDKIRNNLSILLGLEKENIGIKAKTFEKLGEIGKENAISCITVISLETSPFNRI